MDKAYCNYEGDTLDNELFISEDSVGFHAEDYQVNMVTVTKSHLKLSYYPKQDVYRIAPKKLVLSKDGLKLNDLWHRCPELPQNE